jgi:hypothetical protein
MCPRFSFVDLRESTQKSLIEFAVEIVAADLKDVYMYLVVCLFPQALNIDMKINLQEC